MVNEAMARRNGTSVEAMIGARDVEYGHRWLTTPEKIEHFRQSEQEVIDSQKPLFVPEEEFVFLDGSTGWFQTTKVPITVDGNPHCLLGVAVDITRHKEAEREIRSSEHRFRTLIEHTTDAIFCYEYDPPIPVDLPIDKQVRRLRSGTLVECNDVCAKAYGAASAKEVVGKQLSELFGTSDESIASLFREMIKGGYRTIDGEGVQVLEDGTHRYFLNNAHGVVESGQLVRVWGTFRDVTEQKLADRELRRLNEELVAERIALNEKNIALTEVLRHMEEEQQSYKHEICDSVEKLIMPVMTRLKRGGKQLAVKEVAALEDSLKAIVAKDIDRFRSNLDKLSSRELDICELIRGGRSSKEIAKELKISEHTVLKHRQAIRRKLQLANKDVNLAAYLRSR
jgi:PAS domain S-box-containing protein